MQAQWAVLHFFSQVAPSGFPLQDLTSWHKFLQYLLIADKAKKNTVKLAQKIKLIKDPTNSKLYDRAEKEKHSENTSCQNIWSDFELNIDL